MLRYLLIVGFLLAWAIPASAQWTFFVPNCTGTDDTVRFTNIITAIGANTGTIRLPYKAGTRCAVGTLTIPANITLDNSDGTGVSVIIAQTLTVLGPVFNPTGRPMFFGPGTTSFAGNANVGTNGLQLLSNGVGGTVWAVAPWTDAGDAVHLTTSTDNVGIGTTNPIFNDDGVTGANVGKWVAIDGGLSGFSAYLGIGGTIPNVTDRVGSLNFYNLAMGGVDHRTAAIFSFNDGTLGTGNLQFFTAPNSIGPVKRMEISSTGDIGINHAPGTGVKMQMMGDTADASTFTLTLLRSGDTPYFFARNDGRVYVGSTNPASVVAPESANIFFVGQSGQFSVSANGDSRQRSLQLTTDTKPTCDSGSRGKFWYVAGGSGIKDTVEVCAKDTADVFAWRVLY